MEYFGETVVEKLPADYAWSPVGGLIVTRKFEGRFAEIAAAEIELRGQGYETSVVTPEDGGYSTLRAVGSSVLANPNPDEPLTDKWSLLGNDLEKSLWTKPEVALLLQRIPEDSADVAMCFRSWVDGMLGGLRKAKKPDDTEILLTVPNILSYLNEEVPDTYSNSDFLYLKQFIRELALGFDTYTVSQYVLRREVVVPRFTNIQPAYANVNRVISSSSMQGEEGVPPDIHFEVPRGYYLKRTPSKDMIAADKWLISLEYWHGDHFSNFIYGNPI
ncbi:MAG TPA: hypothetical protein VEH27_03825 [Methylomirabilota bacterium]|nr:hypothetical protein [Methylomirabilota bacterium]